MMHAGAHKPHDDDSYQRNHVPAVQKFTEFCRKIGKTVVEHPNKYAVDMISPSGKDQFELEHREIKWWTRPEFPFDEVNILARKKYLEDGKKHYVVFSPNWKRMGIIHKDVVKTFIRDDNLHDQPNRLWDKEKVYRIPKKKFDWYDI
jgi:hypothetical protein